MFSIDLTSRIPIYEQIYQKIVNLIINGTLAENDQLPSVRSLAKSTGVNPNTVSKAYQELERNGVIYSVPGRGSFVSAQNYDEFRKKVLTDFDSTVNEAFEKGISPEDLKARIDNLYLSYGKD
ncbi:GntR family transcriptional regulator [Ruminococcus flavefaciens]|jgi:GntR family transcriptional regulator|uniref:GntR family transcriptional regulator n=1 Tax=Ruminococcus flavefaciens TaxID=1265 RepID=A0A1K1NJU6_RUMFL|nr:GntR family transcriptional regulator [Ruminococcus flavefaciens]SFW35596.1 GntR family transcriptional regulator [Ruminococcus flavefaciens]